MFSMESQFSPGGHGVCATECNLADDAPWKKIQKNTFTRWCNEHLRCVDRAIHDLQFDLNDGLTLIALLEVLSHKKMPRKYHTRPTFRQMRLDNVSVALEFLEQEKIKLVSIDSKAIVDGNMKLILGLVWTLILHYSISSHLLEDGEAKKQTPELRLLGWIQGKVPELPITNFNQDWMDGKALGALVDGLAPGLCPDWESWDEMQRVDNAREAMQQADEWLGVPQVIAPEEIIDPCVDEQSIMTYLSMFPKAQLKPGAPLKPKSVSKAKACRASGRGLQPAGVRVGHVASFKVDTSRAGPGHLEVHVRGPDGMDVPVKHKEDSEDFYFQYEPNIVGNHIISITWGGEHIFKSPFEVGVGPKAGPQMIRAWGPGLEHGVVEMSADFIVESVGATAGMLGFAIEGPSQARIECDDQDDGSCDVRFWPTKPGEYAVHVTCDDEEIEDSPFVSYINPNKKECYPHKVKVFGMGESQEGFILNRLMEFTVDARFAGDGSLGIQAQNIEGKPVSVDVKCKQPGLYTCFYTPTSLVKHTVFVTWGGVGVPGSPFRVTPGRIKFEPSCNTSNIKTQGSDHNGEGIGLDLAKSTNSLFKLDLNVTSPENVPADANKVTAYGPGLEGGFVGTLADFIIDTNDSGSGQLSVTVDGPGPAKIQCSDNQDGSCTVTYLPVENGEHLINIVFQGVHIPGSPFHADIQMPFDPAKVVVSGPGLKRGKVGEPCVVNIDCGSAGFGELSVEAVSETGQKAKTEVQKNKDGTCTVVYVPLTAGVYTLRLKYGGKVLANIPSEVIVDPAVCTSRVKLCGSGADGGGDAGELKGFEGEQKAASVFASGTGLLQGLTGERNHFTITARSGGAGGVAVTVEGPSDAKVSCTDRNDGRYDVQYTPSVPGLYQVNITSGGEHIEGSPFKVPVKEVSDKSDVKISGPGLESGVCTQIPQTFTIDCSKTGNALQSVAVMTPSGKIELVDVKDTGDGTYSLVYCPSMEGDHSLVVKYAEEEAFSSPFAFRVLPNKSTNKLKASEPGLESGVGAQIPQTFTRGCEIDPADVTDNADGTFSAACSPDDDDDDDANKLKVLGPGLCAKVPQTFTIDCSKTGRVPESVAVKTPNGDMELVEVTDSGDGTYSVVYCPTVEGAHHLVVKHDDGEEFCRPLNFQVCPVSDANRLKVSGPGLESGLCAPESVPVITPNGNMELVEVTNNRVGTNSPLSVEGDHSSVVRYADGDEYVSDSSRKVKVSVPGLESEVCAQIPQTFTIGCSKTGDAPQSVAVMTPSGTMEIVKVTDNGDGTYSVAYSPSAEGAHSLKVKYADEAEFSNLSNFQVLPTNDANKLKVSGPGLESGLCVKVPQSFTIDCSKTGEAPESVAVMTPNGHMELVEVTDNGDGIYSVVYSPSVEGAHHLVVKYADEEEFQSPYQFQVLPSDSSKKMKVSVPGLESGVCMEIPHTFITDCGKDGNAPDSVAIMTPSGNISIVDIADSRAGTYSAPYSPFMEGAHCLAVKCADEDDFTSFSNFQVLHANDVKTLKVSGPGLESGLCAKAPQTFTIDCSETGETPESVAVMTPSGHMELVEVTDNGDGTYSVVYSPSVEGAHHLVVKYAEENEFCSPYPFQVLPSDSSKKMKVSVPGLDSGVCAQIPQTFTIGCSKTGDAPQSAAVMTPSGKMELVDVTDNGDGTYSVAFCPSMEGAYSIMVTYGDEEDFCNLSNFQVLPINDGSKLEVSGPGLESGLCVKAPQIFTIDCSKTGDTPEFVAVMTPNGTMELVEVTDNGHGTFSVAYSPHMEGAHSLVVKYADRDEFCSPYDFHVLPTNDANKKEMESGLGVKVSNGKMELAEVMDIGDEKYSLSIEGSPFLFKYTDEEEFCSPHCFQTLPHDSSRKLKVSVPGLESGVCAQIPQTFTIGCSKTGDAPQSVAVMTPTGEMELLKVTDIGNGAYSVAYAPSMDGAHSIMVKYTEEDDFSSLSNFQVLPTNDDKKLKVSGPGLESGLCAKCPQTFTIDCSKTGEVPESVAVMTPSGKMELVEVTDNGDGTYSLSYSPSVEGAHSLLVKYADEEEFCSPYNFHVLPSSDTSKLRGSGSDVESKPCAKVPQTFTIDCSKTGEAPESVAMVMPNGKVELVEVRDCGDGKYSVAWSPAMDGSHSLVVKYADEDEYRCPFRLHVLSSHDAHKVRVSGPGLLPGLPASLPAHFTVDTAEAGEGQLSVEIVDPDGRSKRPRIHDNCDGTYDVSYVPDKVGDYKITIEYSGDEIPTSPYHVWAIATGDANKCIVTGPELGSIVGAGEEIVFVVNTQSAGVGKVSCFVLTPDGTEVEADVTEREDGTFEICYTTAQPGSYIISASFGGESLFTWPFEVMGRDAQDDSFEMNRDGRVSKSRHEASSGDGFQPVMKHGSYIPLRSVDQQNGLTIFNIVMAWGLDDGEITGEVHMPSGSRAQAEVTDNRDGTATLMYEPTEEGLHQIHIKVNGATVSESPLQFYVNNTSKRELMAHGPGLVYGTSNDIAAFTIFNKDLLQGDLDIALEGPSKAEIRCLNNRDGTCTVTYLPTVPGAYNIFVRYNDEDITGSPFTAKIAGPSAEAQLDPTQLRSQVRFGKGADVTLDITEEDVSLLSVSIMSPSGRDVSCLLKRQPDRHIGISFIPKEVGEHLVSVLKNDEHVANSPIPLTINLLEIGDASQVKVFGPGLAKGFTCEMSDFVVDTREAGYGGLSLAIEGPSNVEIQTEELEDGTCGVSFCPTEAGTYTVSVKFTDEHVPGSPFSVLVTESDHVTESRTHCQGAAVVANVGKTCGINLKKTDHQMSGLNMSAEGVSRVSPPWPSFLSDASKVASSGQGLKTAFIGKTNIFTVDCSKAGTNLLLVGMHGPTIPCEQVSIKHLGNNHYDISYVVKEKGSYILAVKWGEEHIPGSPFHVFVP